MEIRPLAADEVERVLAVLGLSRLHQGDGFYLVGWDGDEPLGHLYLALTDPPEMHDVLVRLEYRRRGIAAALIAAAERDAAGRGWDRMRVSVSIDNGGAQALYRGCGYEDFGVPPRRVKGTIVIRTGPLEVDETLLTWEKRLEGQTSE
ncbi:MAG: hypothetical protein QOJ13_1810 [Gaiellales bacterium]|nr:hypothetical protein [Gaiellales bacterium]